MHRCRYWWLLSAISLLACGTCASAEDARGITVGAPKVFDNRTLNLMLERLTAQLAGINVIDQKALGQALGTIQGSQVEDFSSSLTLQASPTPALSTSGQGGSSSGTGSAADSSGSGNSGKGSSSKSGDGSSKSGDSSSSGSLPDLLAAPGALSNLKYNMSASDLLSEQVDLTYQIINLQMLLDRSLSDRLLGNGKPRLQTVVGLNVSVDPPRDAEKAVAVVEITLTKNDDSCQKTGTCGEPPKCDGGVASAESPALVAAMPQEHTYNSVALNSRSNAFGGSAVAKVVTIGYTARKRGQTFYMFRDNDTVSFERQSCPGSGKITFGWAFRPVLGRRSVAPGSRQLFAVVSLPEDDSSVADQSKSPNPVHYAAEVRAYWRKYDPHTLTSANDDEIRPWAKVGHVLSLGTSLTYAPAGLTNISNFPIDVPRTSAYLNALLPEVDSVNWHPIGTKQAFIAIRGQNLFYDTQVAVGDKLLTGAKDGLRLISDQGMDVITDRSALYGDVAILGRYGPAKLLERDVSFRRDLSIGSVDFGEAVGGFIRLTVTPKFNGGLECLEGDDLNDGRLGQPILFLNGAALAGPYSYPRSQLPDCPCLTIEANVPEAAIPKLQGYLTLKFPFITGFSASTVLYNPTTVFNLQVLTKDKDYLVRRTDAPWVRPHQNKFSAANWRLIIDSEPAISLEDHCEPHYAADANHFCLLTANDNFARIVIAKTPSCSDDKGGAEGADQPEPKTPAEKNKGKNPKQKAQAQNKVDNKETKTCGPKTFLLQMATGTAPDLTWVSTIPLSASSEKSDTEASKPTIDKNQSQSASQHDIVWRSFTGSGLTAIDSVTLSGSKLEINPSKDGKSIDVLIPEWATAYPAEVDLTFHDKQGADIGTAKVSVKTVAAGANK